MPKTHHGLEQLSRSLSSLSCLKKLYLTRVRCSEHTDRCCIPVLALQKHNKLRILYLLILSVEVLLLPMKGARARVLRLKNVTMAHHGLEQISKSLSSLYDSWHLSLGEVDCSEHRNRSRRFYINDIRSQFWKTYFYHIIKPGSTVAQR